MESSFYRGLKKIKKNYFRDKGQDIERDIKNLLYKNLDVDEGLCDDLYYRYCDGSENIFDSAEILADLVDVFNGQYDEVIDPLKEEDWVYIKNIVNASAEDMNMESMTYIMKLLVERGLY